MAFTFIAWASNASDSTSATTIDTTTALNVAAGDLLITWAKHEGAPTTVAIADSVSGNSHTLDAGDKVNHTNGDLSATFGYVLSATADASFTGRATFGAARPFRSIIVAQFRPDSGETVTKDTSATGQGNGTAVQSGTYTTSGTDVVAMGGYGEYVAATSSSHQINGVAADAVRKTDVTHGNNFTAAWYRILSSTFTNGRSTCTAGSSGDWIGNGIAFKSVASGTTVTPGPASLTLTTFAPTVQTPRLVTPGTASLTITAFAPTITIGTRVVPNTATLTLTAFTPSVSNPRLVTPGLATLTLTTFAPTVTASSGTTLIPGTASLVLTSFAPTVTGGGAAEVRRQAGMMAAKHIRSRMRRR